MRSDLVDLEVDLIRETDKAVLVRSHNTGTEAWVPRSQCEIEPQGNHHTLTLSERTAIEKELV